MNIKERLATNIAAARSLGSARETLKATAIDEIARLVEGAPQWAGNRLAGKARPLGNTQPKRKAASKPVLISHERFLESLALKRLRSALLALDEDDAVDWAEFLRWMTKRSTDDRAFDFEWGSIDLWLEKHARAAESRDA